MRYHKVTAISATHFTSIVDSAWISLNPSPVLSLFDKRFDTRRMTEEEVTNFICDFMREIASEIQAGILRPH